LKIRNKTLYSKVKNFVFSAIKLLKKLASKEALPVQQITRYSFKKNIGYSKDEELEVDFFLFIFRHMDEIDKLPDFKECAKYILKNPVTRRATGWRTKDGQPAKDLPLKLDCFRILYSLLGIYLKRVRKFSFVESEFKETYMEFEKYGYKSIVSYRLTAPLQGLSGSIGEVNFGNTLKLRRILDSEKAAYLQAVTEPFGIPSSFGFLDITEVEYTLETIYSHRKDTAINTSSCRKGFEDIVTTLRLFKSGRFGFDVIKTETTSWAPHAHTSYGWGPSRQDLILRGFYDLDKSEKPGLLRLWRRFKSFKKAAGSSQDGKHISLALKRFNFGVEESDAENRIIDFFVAFEALCLPERDELTYRLSNRVAIMLGKNDEEADSIREFMTKAYRLRSEIVHGGEVKPITIKGETVNVNDTAQRIEKYLRETLKFVLVLSKKYKKRERIMALLDKSLIDTKIRRQLRKLKL